MTQSIHIAIGSDHAGFDYKERLKLFLMELGHNVTDFGTDSDKPVDYPQLIFPLAEAVAADDFDRGIVLGASGNGEAIAANRIVGIRCALCWNVQSAVLARKHNNANMLSLGQRLLRFELVTDIVEAWLETKFEAGRHARRIRMIDRSFDRLDPQPRTLPHRASLQEDAPWICTSCREEFSVPIDLSAGKAQQSIEECPICCYENVIRITIDQDGNVALTAAAD